MQERKKGGRKAAFVAPETEQKLWQERSPLLRTPSKKKGGGEPLRPVTRRGYWNAYTDCCAKLNVAGKCDPNQGPAERWESPENVNIVLQARQQNGQPYAPKTNVFRLFGLQTVLRVITGKPAPAAVIEAQRGLQRNPVRAKTIVDPDDFIKFGREVMWTALAAMPPDWKTGYVAGDKRRLMLRCAVRHRIGFQICWVAYTGLRMRNTANAKLEQNLILDDDLDDSEEWWLRFEREEMKNKHAIDRLFPTELIPDLETYRALVRPILCRGRYSGNMLWISERGEPLIQNSIARDIKRVTSERFPGGISPHWIRDCIATANARKNPADSSRAAWTLANDFDTMNSTYNSAGYAPARRLVTQRMDQWFAPPTEVPDLEVPPDDKA